MAPFTCVRSQVKMIQRSRPHGSFPMRFHQEADRFLPSREGRTGCAWPDGLSVEQAVHCGLVRPEGARSDGQGSGRPTRVLTARDGPECTGPGVGAEGVRRVSEVP